MLHYKFFLFTFVVLNVLNVVPGQETRCFSFTWLGPRYNNNSVFLNATCADATQLSSGVPCFQPLVVSYDGTPPDTDYIWTHYAEQATCILAETDVCATYAFYFNGFVENVTHMCTRVVDSMGDAVTSGCYSQRNGSSEIRACFCRSIAGGVPCNEAGVLQTSVVFLSALVFMHLVLSLKVK